MTADEYRAALFAVYVAAKMLAQHSIDDIRAAMERADILAPIVDPTLWMRKHEAMEGDRRAVDAALPLWRLGRELAEMAVGGLDAEGPDV